MLNRSAGVAGGLMREIAVQAHLRDQTPMSWQVSGTAEIDKNNGKPGAEGIN